jgi:GMP synthase-like glutamine amidotransferase
MRQLHLGILQADSVLPQFQPVHGNYPGMIQRVLQEASSGLDLSLQFSVFDVEHGEYPETMDTCDGYLITGSKQSVYDDEPWIDQLKHYVQALNTRKVKLVGICFGHQLIAEALGGRTLSAEAGWGVGIHVSQVQSQQWFMNPPLESFSILYSHKDQVARLPADAELIAGNDFCPNSMFCIGEHALALQGHPEFTRDYAEDLMRMREEILGPEKFHDGIESLGQPMTSVEVGVWILRFIQGP